LTVFLFSLSNRLFLRLYTKQSTPTQKFAQTRTCKKTTTERATTAAAATATATAAAAAAATTTTAAVRAAAGALGADT